MNPAVTTALASIKKCPLKQMASYIAAQYMGSFLAAAVVYLIYKGNFIYFLLQPKSLFLTVYEVKAVRVFLVAD